MTDSGTSIPLWCPRCLTTVGELERCPRCGLPQQGPAPARLREVVSRLDAVRGEKDRLTSEQLRLADEQARLIERLGGAAPLPTPLPPPPVRGAPEWRPERVRDVLLWLGVTLLALAAVTFTAVAWARLADTGRAGLLVGFTGLAGLGAVWLRSRLAATAEALAGLTLALVFVDCIAARRAGLGDGLDVATWAIGAFSVTALVGFGAAALRLNTGRATGPPLVLVAGSAALITTTQTGWTFGVGAAALASAAVVGAVGLDRSRDWRTAAGILAGGALGLTGAALIASFVGWVVVEDAEDVQSAIAFGMAAAPLVLAVWLSIRVRTIEWLASVLIGAAAAIVMGAAVMAVDVDTEANLTVAAALAVLAIVAARLAGPRLGYGLFGAGVAYLGALGVSRLEPMLDAVSGSLQWSDDPWTESLDVDAAAGLMSSFALSSWTIPLAVGVAAVVSGLPLARWRPLVPPPLALFAAPVAGAIAVCTGVLAADASVGTALTVESVAAIAMVVAAVVADRRDAERALAACLIPAGLLVIPATGWALATRGATGVFVSIVLVAATGAAIAIRRPWARVILAGVAAVSALARTGVAVVQLDGSTEAAGFAIAVAAAVVLLLGTPLGRRAPEGLALEIIGLSGLMLGASIAGPSPEWLAASVTVAPPAFAASAAGDSDRRWYGWFALATAVVAVWAWLFAADVGLLEAYTLPAAAAALAAGVIVWRTDDTPDSIVDFGPGLVIGLGPTLIAVLDRGGLARSLPLTAAAFIAVVVGARLRLRGPIVIGAATLLALAIDVLAPVAARVPRWSVLAIAGAVLLWLGSTADRRLRDARRLRSAYNRLG